MRVPRQEVSDDLLESGRVNQKRRTRAAITGAARELLAQGVAPTVAQAAEVAGVSRTTAYRYFPTQDALLIEVAVVSSVDEIDEMSEQPLGDEDAEERLRKVLGTFNRSLLEDETRHRTALRLYLDLWLASSAEGVESPVVRQGHRRQWISRSLGTLDDQLSAKQRRRLAAALALVTGIEAIVTLRDVCQLDADEALEVTDWAIHALIRTATEEAKQGGK